MAASEGYNIVSYKMKGYVAKLNTSNGNIMWKKNYLDSTIFYKKPVLNADGSFIISGTISTFDAITGNSNPCARIVKFTATGDTIWSRTYRTKPDRECYFYDIQATPDSGYVMCGFGFDSTNTQRAWVVKTDCMGADSITHYFPNEVCTTTGWVTSLESEPNPAILSLLKQDRFEIYPNPANTEITILLDDKTELIRVLNNLGQILIEVKPEHSKEILLNISELPNGTYNVLQINNNGNSKVKKLSVIK
jgi:hypothetical protein